MARMKMSVFVVMLLALVGLGACSDSGDASPKDDSGGLPTVPAADWVDETGKATVVIDTRDNVFKPENIKVSAGTKIVFENNGRNPHNVLPSEDKQFDEIPTPKLKPGDSAPLKLDGAGEYPYYCSLHGTPTRGMKGRIEVVG